MQVSISHTCLTYDKWDASADFLYLPNIYLYTILELLDSSYFVNVNLENPSFNVEVVKFTIWNNWASNGCFVWVREVFS